MARPLDKITILRIHSMYEQGYHKTTIADVTGVHYQRITRLIDKAGTERISLVKVPAKPHKYDHLFDEPVCEGKYYREYIK